MEQQGIAPIDLFSVENEASATELSRRAVEINAMRLETQKKAQAEALEKVEASGFEHFIYVSSENFHKGVVGLVATQLSQQFHVPAFCGNL